MILYEELIDNYYYDTEEIDDFIDIMIKEMLLYIIFN